MDYRIVVTVDAQKELERYMEYLIFEKGNAQAARNVLDDFESTKEILKRVAGSLKLCDHPRLRQLGYRRINFLNHRYFLLYRVIDQVVFIDNIFHDLQDYENKMH